MGFEASPFAMIIDFHTHILPPSIIKQRGHYITRDATLSALFANPRFPMATAEELVAAMDEAGVDTAVVMGMGWASPEMAREANDYLLESAARYPERLVAFCSANPAWGAPALREIERCARLGARGIGELHPDTQHFDPADPRVMAPIMHVAQEYRLVLVTHASEPVGHQYVGKGTVAPSVLMGLIEQFPDAPIVCAHWGGGLPFYALMPEVRSALVNTYFDTAASPFLYQPQVFSVAVQLVGAGAILMGSDYPLVKPKRMVRQVAAAGLSDDDKIAILGGNAQRLLGLTKGDARDER